VAPQELLHLCLSASLACLAWAVARRDAEHRWVAAFVTWMLFTDLARRLLIHLRQGAPKPYTGLARVEFHADQLLVLSWSFLFAALCLHMFARRRPWPALGGWALTFLVCLDYPNVSGPVLGALYRGVSLVALVVCWAAILWGMTRRRELEPTLAHLIVMLYAVTDVVLNLVPFAGGYFSSWPLVRIANLMLLSGCTAAHVWFLVRRRAAATAPA
jgi:hypothetical protein